MVPYFRMRASGTTINLTVENDARTNAGAHGDINQTGLTLAGTPAGFAQGRSIGIVFHGHGNVKDTFQIPHRIRASPVWKEIDITNFTGNRIHGPRTADADTSDFRSGLCSRVAQHCCDAIQGAGIAGIRCCRQFRSRHQVAFRIHHAHGDLGSADVDCCDHSLSPPAAVVLCGY